MRSGGQRQDVAFLALAVAVLTIAVALFVVMKSIPRERADEPQTEEPQQEVVEEPKEEPAPEKATQRDPFRSQQQGRGGVMAKPEAALKLVGITLSETGASTAVVYRGKQRYHLKLGQQVEGYRLVRVTQNGATLEGPGGRVTLVLRPPKRGEEGG